MDRLVRMVAVRIESSMPWMRLLSMGPWRAGQESSANAAECPVAGGPLAGGLPNWLQDRNHVAPMDLLRDRRGARAASYPTRLQPVGRSLTPSRVLPETGPPQTSQTPRSNRKPVEAKRLDRPGARAAAMAVLGSARQPVMKNVFAWCMMGLAATPVCAHHFRPSSLNSYSVDQLLQSVPKDRGALLAVVVAGFVCVGSAAVVGALIPLDGGGKGRTSVLRSPAAALVLVPLGLAAILTATPNVCPQVLKHSLSIRLCCQHWMPVCGVAALIAAITADFVNTSELSFQRFNVVQRAGAICCLLPMGILVVTANVIGLVGGGIFLGAMVGRLFSCPMTVAFIAAVLSVGFLSTQDSLFPSFPSPGNK